jgi:hypothetical protein
MTKVDLKKAISVPQSVFKYPEAVLHCRELSHDDKMTVLRNWKQELVQLQKAAEEDMLDERGPSDVGSRLAAVTQAMIALDERSPH